MKITEMIFYDGSREKICKLGLADLFLEVQQILLTTTVTVKEEKQANGAAEIRKMIDTTFEKDSEWEKITAGGVDWKKKIRYNRTFIAQIGVEIQISARSDLLIRDVVHLRNSIQEGEIEVGVIVVPSIRFQNFLPDRTPSVKDARRYIEEEFREAQNYPIIILAIEHDGIGDAIEKRKRKG
jgi:hypothetical protein